MKEKQEIAFMRQSPEVTPTADRPGVTSNQVGRTLVTIIVPATTTPSILSRKGNFGVYDTKMAGQSIIP